MKYTGQEGSSENILLSNITSDQKDVNLSIVEVNDRPCGLVPFLSDKIELGDSDLKIMLKKHHEKRKHQPVRLEGVVSRFSV